MKEEVDKYLSKGGGFVPDFGLGGESM